MQHTCRNQVASLEAGFDGFVSDDMPGRVSEDMPIKMSEDMPDGFPLRYAR